MDFTELTLFAMEGGFQIVKLEELSTCECDEVFLPPNIMLTGHDDVVEIWDYAIDLSWVDTASGQVKTTKDTLMLVR